jgi:uncharacterized protein YcfL
MKTAFLSLIAALLFVSCSSNERTNQSSVVKGAFVYEISNCDNQGNPEIDLQK